MPDAMTRGDSLRTYLTGASADDGAQVDPNLSLGNHKSSTEAASLGIAIADAIADITVDFASGGNSLGDGSLECTDIDALRWMDAGGAFGAEEAIANGETKILEADGDPGAFLRVTRTSATNLVPGVSTITLTELIDNLFGFDDVSSAEASAGDDEYRCVMLKNVSANNVVNAKMWIGLLGISNVSDIASLPGSGAGTIDIGSGDFSSWPARGYCRIENSGGALKEIVYYSSRSNTSLTVPTDGRGLLGTTATAGTGTDLIHAVPGVRIAKDTDGVVASGTPIQTIADESTPPTAVSWSTAITEGTGLSIGTLTPGQQIGIWIHRQIPANALSTTTNSVLLNRSFEAA